MLKISHSIHHSHMYSQQCSLPHSPPTENILKYFFFFFLGWFMSQKFLCYGLFCYILFTAVPYFATFNRFKLCKSFAFYCQVQMRSPNIHFSVLATLKQNNIIHVPSHVMIICMKWHKTMITIIISCILFHFIRLCSEQRAVKLIEGIITNIITSNTHLAFRIQHINIKPSFDAREKGTNLFHVLEWC